MYKDIITYELAKGTSKEQLIKIAKQIVDDWMKNQSRFIKWEIHTNNNGTYTDIVYWKTKKEAKKATAEMVNIPNAADWYGCYKEGTIKSKNLMTIAEFE